jgi:hypothetical protein
MGRSGKAYTLHKPRGLFSGRVQAVGPEHFGILCFDCAKARNVMCKVSGPYGNVTAAERPAAKVAPIVRKVIDLFGWDRVRPRNGSGAHRPTASVRIYTFQHSRCSCRKR